MTTNIGTTDRLARLLIGSVMILAPLLNLPALWSSAPLAFGSMLIGAILVATAGLRFCPLYRIVGVSTCKV